MWKNLMMAWLFTAAPPLKGTELSSYGDHRIAMSFLVAGLSAQGETVVTDAECINTSYPGFERDLAQFL